VPLPPTFDARLVRARPLSSSVRELVFERADGAPFVFDPGQWVSLVLPLPEGELRRAYSIASAPDGSPRFELAVTHVRTGPGSTYLHTLEPGATLRAVGPQGFFTRPLESAGPSLFVATGTGVVPFRSMIRAAIAAGSKAPVWLLFGVRHEEDILWREELEALAAGAPHVRVEVTLSQPGGGWKGRRGYVQAHVEELWVELSRVCATPHAYVCGLEKMVGSVRDVLRKQLGAARQQVHSERYD
jgi:CDP-4-dehydro-6-deoxyglucose reductase